MKKLRVEYDKNKCIGQGNCAAIAPYHFELVGKKATLKNSDKISKGTFAVDIDCDSDAEGSIISAGKSCPVNAIRVIDSERNKDIVSVKIKEENVKEIIAKYDDEKEFVLDAAGYFLIRLDRKNKNIVQSTLSFYFNVVIA